MSADRRISLVLDSRLDEIDRLHKAIAAFCADAGRGGEAAAFVLCAEELVTNTILHGFGGEAGHAVSVDLTASADAMAVRIVDDAQAFDPTVDIEADLDSDIETREIGGLGRHLVSTLMDTFSYARDEGRNVVSFGRATRELKGAAT